MNFLQVLIALNAGVNLLLAPTIDLIITVSLLPLQHLVGEIVLLDNCINFFLELDNFFQHIAILLRNQRLRLYQSAKG